MSLIYTMRFKNKNSDASLSVIIPTLNEETTIARTLAALQPSSEIEVIVVDGGSTDATTQIAQTFGARVVNSDRGRGNQLHSGARYAQGSSLLFLHADTICPPDAKDRIDEALASDPGIIGGNFAIRFDGQTRAARFMTWLYPKLGRLGLLYGDSGIFVRATVYNEIGGFKAIPIFEDLDLVRRLRKRGRLVHIPAALLTSSRRFDGRSFVLTFAHWSIMQLLYWLGVPPRVLGQLYTLSRTTK